MEVHHPPKSIKDYASEFIVIFVALTLGFFVENQREHYIEGLREKELAQSLLKDLATDSIDLKEFQQLLIISSGSLRYIKNDTLAKAISDLKMLLKRIEYRQNREKEYFYAHIQPWVVNHLNLAQVDQHRNGLPRDKMMAILANKQSSAPGKPYFLETDQKDLAAQTANMLR